MHSFFEPLSNWLLHQTLDNAELSETVVGLADRLIAGGMPVSRIVINKVMLHPIIGIYDLTWDADSNRVEIDAVPRSIVNSAALENAPFADLHGRKVSTIRADLSDAEQVKRYSLFRKLAEDGVTDYAAWSHIFADTDVEARLRPGILVSICTKQHGGFSDENIEQFQQLLVPLFVCVQMATERFLAKGLLGAYLGQETGTRVLNGQSSRGDGDTIDSVVFYSDMRDSSRLSQELDQDAYLAHINRYFDCVAGEVMDNGGEVLKFIGDGVLAIFPTDANGVSIKAKCDAALSAARGAFDRSLILDDPPSFGVALHVGPVIYGNVGTEHRLDYTATGSAVSLTARCEELNRTFGTNIIATSTFAEQCTTSGKSLGAIDIRGFADPVNLVSFG